MDVLMRSVMKSKRKNNFEKDYVKAIKKIMREEIGFQPTRISKNKKKYSRKNYKIEID
jgi:hypothetical protein